MNYIDKMMESKIILINVRQLIRFPLDDFTNFVPKSNCPAFSIDFSYSCLELSTKSYTNIEHILY